MLSRSVSKWLVISSDALKPPNVGPCDYSHDSHRGNPGRKRFHDCIFTTPPPLATSSEPLGTSQASLVSDITNDSQQSLPCGSHMLAFPESYPAISPSQPTMQSLETFLAVLGCVSSVSFTSNWTRSLIYNSDHYQWP